MAIPLVAVAGKITAAIMNAVITQVNGIAMIGVVPTSVGAGSGTATVAPGGAVSFTNCTNVSLNGVFSGTYDNYRIAWSSSARSAATSIQFRLRLAGTDDTSANYDFVKGVDSGTTRTITSSSSSTGGPLDQGVAVNQGGGGFIDIVNPAQAAGTGLTGQSTGLASSVLYSSQVAIAHEVATAFDGFTMYPLTAGSTWSGIIRVYGYNNLG